MHADDGARCDACGASVGGEPWLGSGLRAAIRCDACIGTGGVRAEHAPEQAPQPRLTTRSGQRLWMRSMGRHVRRTREALGMTQGDLASAAGTSQAAVSRLEQGGALGTPYLVVVAVQQALTTALRELGRTGALSDAPHDGALAEIDGRRRPAPVVIGEDDYWQRYVAAYRTAPVAVRTQLVLAVEAASALTSRCS